MSSSGAEFECEPAVCKIDEELYLRKFGFQERTQ
jgi:hypothetical protein